MRMRVTGAASQMVTDGTDIYVTDFDGNIIKLSQDRNHHLAAAKQRWGVPALPPDTSHRLHFWNHCPLRLPFDGADGF